MNKEEKDLEGADAAVVATAGSSDRDAAIARHTPGPWETIASNCSNLIHVETSDTHVTVCSLPKKRSGDAQLIAAAPELLEALKAMLTLAVDPLGGVIDRAIRQRANEALAKAEGRH